MIHSTTRTFLQLSDTQRRTSSRDLRLSPLSSYFINVITMTAIESAVIVTSLGEVVGGDDYTAGRLTTTFTYDAGCTGNYWQYSADETGTEQNMVKHELITQCQPMETWPVYSPGICPEGMTLPTVEEMRHSTYTKGIRGCGTELNFCRWRTANHRN
jgi:hypothetical protein